MSFPKNGAIILSLFCYLLFSKLLQYNLQWPTHGAMVANFTNAHKNTKSVKYITATYTDNVYIANYYSSVEVHLVFESG